MKKKKKKDLYKSRIQAMLEKIILILTTIPGILFYKWLIIETT